MSVPDTTLFLEEEYQAHLVGNCWPMCPHCEEEGEEEIKDMYIDIGGEG